MAAPNGINSVAIPSTPLTQDQYAGYAHNDPGYMALVTALQGNESAAKTAARGGINSAAITLGAVPTDGSLSDWLDPGTAAAAAANPISTWAGLNNTHTQNMRDLQNSLAARGAYDSGELTYGLGNESTRDAAARAQALGSLTQYANGLFGNLGSMQAQDAMQLGQGLGDAVSRQLALHPGTTTTAIWDDTSGAYRDQYGNLYDQYGNPTSGGSGNQTTISAPPGMGSNYASGPPITFNAPVRPGYTNDVIGPQGALGNEGVNNYKVISGAPSYFPPPVTAPTAAAAPPNVPQQPITTNFGTRQLFG